MKRLTCEMCGSTDLVKQDGVFVCQSCGCKYSVEEAKKMMIEGTVDVSGSTVKVDNTGMIESYLQMAENAVSASNYAEAENYANKIIEIEPKNVTAWYIKGTSAGWQTTGRNNRYPESITACINAWKFSDETKKINLVTDISEEAKKISLATLQMECNSFVSFRSQENATDLTDAIGMIVNQNGILEKATNINIQTPEFRTMIARVLNSCGVNASNAADKEFGPELGGRDNFSWNNYTGAQDRCLDILERAYNFSEDNDLCLTICKNYMAIATETRDSCSYKFVATSYGSYYDEDNSFSSSAKRVRSNKIEEWEKKERQHDPKRIKENKEAAISICEDKKNKRQHDLAYKHYWAEHKAEKEVFECERQNLIEQKEQIDKELETSNNHIALKNTTSKLQECENALKSLGFFKGKEKRALQEQIEMLSKEHEKQKSLWDADTKEAIKKKNIIDDKIKEISKELSKDRGVLEIDPPMHINLLIDPVTPLQLIDYLDASMPDGYRVDGSGKAAIVDMMKVLYETTTMAMKMLRAQLGQSAEDEDDGYNYNPNAVKPYRIGFCSQGQKTATYIDLYSKDYEKPIEGKFEITFDGERTAQNVADYACIVSAILKGVSSDIDMSTIERKIIEKAFGNIGEEVLHSANMDILISSDAKSTLKIELKGKNAEKN